MVNIKHKKILKMSYFFICNKKYIDKSSNWKQPNRYFFSWTEIQPTGVFAHDRLPR